jgi:cytochrome c oxidase subunit 3
MEAHKDYVGSKMGMWIFLLSEVLLFGGLFVLYAAYRFKFRGDFHLAAMELDKILGTLNTVILLTSSLTMALSIASIRKGRRVSSLSYLALTVLLGLLFLVNKYIEWSAKVGHGLYPNSPALLERSNGEILFFGLYYAMTGLHGLHVLVGVGLLAGMCFFLVRGRIRSTDFILLENSGLYWHLVDIIWIFLFPLFYLIT